MTRRFKYKVPVETKAGPIIMKGGPLMHGTDNKKKFEDWLEWKEYERDKAEAEGLKGDTIRSIKELRKGLRKGVEELRKEKEKREKARKYGT